MSVGLIALLDDIATLAKVAAASLDDVMGQAARTAAASLDDVAGQAMKAGARSAGVVIDDAAVTPRYVVGLSPARELPIVARIARGSLRNKLVILLPMALALSAFAPWGIMPLLMLGGAYLCYEGTEKLVEALFPHAAGGHADGLQAGPADHVLFEEQTVAGAVRTDFILSAEIMAIALAAIPEVGSVWMQAVVLALVGIGITVLVYGGVAVIVKADDVGVALARNASASAIAGLGRCCGRGLVHAMPRFLAALSAAGTAAMLWVGGGIILHGLESFGLAAVAHAVHDIAHAAGAVSPVLPGAVEWMVGAVVSGLLGVVVGLPLIPVGSWIAGLIRRRFISR